MCSPSVRPQSSSPLVYLDGLKGRTRLFFFNSFFASFFLISFLLPTGRRPVLQHSGLTGGYDAGLTAFRRSVRSTISL